MEEKLEMLRNQKKWEEMKRMKEKEDKKNRLIRKEGKEKRLEMTKWIHSYIKENSDNWEKEKIKRINKKNEEIANWERKTILEKIKTLKEKFSKKKEKEEKGDEEDSEMVTIIDKVETNWVRWRNAEDRGEDETRLVEEKEGGENDLIDIKKIDLTIKKTQINTDIPRCIQ